MSSAKDVVIDVGRSIITDRNVVKASQTLISSAAQGGAQIVGAAGAAIIGTGSVAGITAAASTAGATLTTAATGVGTAVMGTTIVSGVTTVASAAWGGLVTVGGAIAAAPVLPILAGAAVIGGFIGWLCSDD